MNKLYVKEKVFSLGGHFTVKDEQQQDRYLVEGSFLKVPKTFTITDMQSRTVAVITKKVFSLLPKFFVEIEGQDQIVIEKELTLFKPRYRIEAQGLEIKGDWLSKNFEVYANGTLAATIQEKWFTWGDTFEVTVLVDALQDIILSLVIAIDFVKHEEQASSSSAST